MAYQVFISYDHRDKLVADAACARLESRGIRCWIAPRDLLAGQAYAEGIALAIQQCKVLVLVFSSSTNLSRHVLNEVERAVSANLTVVPFRIENVAPSNALGYFIGSVHWLDALTPPMDAHLDQLAESALRLLGMADGKRVIPAPVPKPKWPLYAGLAALLVAVGGALFFWPQRQVEGPRTELLRTESPRTEPLRTESPPAALANAIVGCWTYNFLNLEFLRDGRVVGFLDGARWDKLSGNSYRIIWPSIQDRLRISPDGRTLTATNNFIPTPFSASRLAGNGSTFAGTWRWGNGLLVTADSAGIVSAPNLRGNWSKLGEGEYLLRWEVAPIDQVGLAADGQSFSGQNQFGVKVGAVRKACVN